MIDEIAIQQTLNKYSEGASRADWDQVMSTFMPDGIWEVPGLGASYQDHAVIRKVMAAFVGQMAYFVQINSPAIIAVTGDKATARSVIRECGKFADRNEALEVMGRYDDELIRTADGWKFTRRTFRAAGSTRSLCCLVETPFETTAGLRCGSHAVVSSGAPSFGWSGSIPRTLAEGRSGLTLRCTFPRQETTAMQRQHVQFELDDNIGVITLNRPEAANAQSPKVLEELDEAWNAADADTRVKVIVLKSTGKHFSAGHDLGSTDGRTDVTEYKADALYDWETRHYLRYAKSWRNIPKPSIAAVQGKCIAAGLMLCWPCDLIVAAENAEFSDPVLHMGILGVEMHAHTWEFGPRKAKELLFTAGAVTAEEARQLGMVNKVVPLEQLVSATMEMAHRIARMDSFALRMAKRAVNHTMDIQGYTAAIDSCFDMHHFGHARAALVTGGMPSLAGLSSMKGKSKS